MQTAMSQTPKQLTPMASNKPKARDETFGFLKPSNTPKLAKPILPRAVKPARQPSDNKLLAGYLAHEFLTKGTLFGKPWDPARADVLPVSAAAHLADVRKPVKVKQQAVSQMVKPGEKRKFEEVSGLLMGNNGVHIPGIVNPAQLTRFLNPQ